MGDINRILSLDLIEDISTGFFLVKLRKLGFRVILLGEHNLLEGGVANKLDLEGGVWCGIITISKIFCKLVIFILINLKQISKFYTELQNIKNILFDIIILINNKKWK